MMTLSVKAVESEEIAVKTGESGVNAILTPEKYKPIPAITPKIIRGRACLISTQLGNKELATVKNK